MKFTLKLILLLISTSAYSFNYSSYEETTLDNIFERSDILVKEHEKEKGISLINPTVRAALSGNIEKMPYQCPNEALFKFMSMVGFNTEGFPPINNCIDLKSKSGRVATFHIQDSLVGFVNEEVKIGEPVNVWALWVYTNDYTKLPYFLTNGYEAAIPPNQCKQQDC